MFLLLRHLGGHGAPQMWSFWAGAESQLLAADLENHGWDWWKNATKPAVGSWRWEHLAQAHSLAVRAAWGGTPESAGRHLTGAALRSPATKVCCGYRINNQEVSKAPTIGDWVGLLMTDCAGCGVHTHNVGRQSFQGFGSGPDERAASSHGVLSTAQGFTD